jgi:hypothetical protein
VNHFRDRSSLRDTIDAAKATLPLPALLARLELPANSRPSSRCPFHEDRSPSFSIFQGARGWRWKCHAGCGNGDEIDFLVRRGNLSRVEAIKQFCEMAGHVVVTGAELAAGAKSAKSQGKSAKSQEPRAKCFGGTRQMNAVAHIGNKTPRSQDDRPTSADAPNRNTWLSNLGSWHSPPGSWHFSPGTEADRRALAALRHVHLAAPVAGSHLGTLFFGQVLGFPSWILTDSRRLCAEARRMDGQPFPAVGTLGARKAHTLRGSVKSWPVGLAVHRWALADFRAILIVEGGPDYLAALHFMLAAGRAGSEGDCLPIAFLGAGVASHIHPEALPLLAGCRVRFYPHHEASEAGLRAVERWGNQLTDRGCECDAFSFAGLRRADGRPVKDLNDCTQIHPEDAPLLQNLLP